ncbi:MAG: metallophosphoesterase [Clostridia bacterium]|nr:metallophosphoesterase [Clostridia bacterium]
MYYLYIVLYFVLNIYPAFRTYQWLHLYVDSLSAIAFGIIFALFPIASVVTFYSHKVPIRVKKVIDWVGGIFMLVFLFSFVFWLFYDLGRLIFKLNALDPLLFEKYGGFAVVLLSASIIIFGYINYTKLHVTNYKVNFNRKIDGGLRAVLISDVHLGAVNSEIRFRDTVSLINKQNADIVFISGDLFNNNFYAIIDPDEVRNQINSIKAKYGVFYCLGNHDAGKTYPFMEKFIESCNVTFLKDEFYDVDGRFSVLGRIDPMPMGGFGDNVRCDLKDIESKHDNDLPVIVLEHNPGTIGEYDGNYELILCGHTHHGQMFPANLVTKMLFKVDYGYYRESPEKPAVIVSSGSGIWAMPFRMASKCEIVTIDIDKN